MQITFKAKIFLGFVSEAIAFVAGILSFSNPLHVLVFVVFPAAIGIIVWYEAIMTRRKEKDDLRRKLPHEMLGILDRITTYAGGHDISYPVWYARPEDDTAELLGDEDYGLLKVFYGSVEARNQYLDSRDSINISDLRKFDRACFDSFLKAYDKVPWVREAVPQTRIDDILSKARQHSVI